MGATLAVIDSQYKVKELLWYMKHHWTFRTVDLMFIGLIHEKWIPVDPNISMFIVIFGNTVKFIVDLIPPTTIQLHVIKTKHIYNNYYSKQHQRSRFGEEYGFLIIQ